MCFLPVCSVSLPYSSEMHRDDPDDECRALALLCLHALHELLASIGPLAQIQDAVKMAADPASAIEASAASARAATFRSFLSSKALSSSSASQEGNSSSSLSQAPSLFGHQDHSGFRSTQVLIHDIDNSEENDRPLLSVAATRRL